MKNKFLPIVVLLSFYGSLVLGQFPCVDGYITSIQQQLSIRNYSKAKNMLLDMRETCKAELGRISPAYRSNIASIITKITKGTSQEKLKRNSQNVIFPKWDSVSRKFGFVDKAGKRIIDFIYDDAEVMEDGYACVKKGDNIGFINREGKEEVPFSYFSITDRGNGDDVVDKNGQSVIPPYLRNMEISVEGINAEGVITLYLNRTILKVGDSMGLYDCSLKRFIIPLAVQEIEGMGQSENIAVFSKITNQLVSSPVLSSRLGMYLLLITKSKDPFAETKLFSVVDFDNQLIVPFGRYDYIDHYGSFDGLIEVGINDRQGFIDCKGVERIAPVYSQVGLPKDGWISARDSSSGLWGFIDYAGKKVLDFRFTDIKSEGAYFHGNLCAVQNDQKFWGFVNKKGDPVINYEYSDVTPFLGKYALVEKNNFYWFMIDSTDKKMTADSQFVYGEYKSGYIDKNGDVVTFEAFPGSDPYFEHLDEKGNPEKISASILPYYINFEGWRRSSYLELKTIDVKSNNAIILLVSETGTMKYRTRSILKKND